MVRQLFNDVGLRVRVKFDVCLKFQLCSIVCILTHLPASLPISEKSIVIFTPARQKKRKRKLLGLLVLGLE